MNLSQLPQTDILKDEITLFLENIAKSPIMLGIAILLVNLGGKYITADLTKYDEKLLTNKIIKKITLFCIAFLSTRDIRFSIIIVFVYCILFHPCGLAYKILDKIYNILFFFCMSYCFI